MDNPNQGCQKENFTRHYYSGNSKLKKIAIAQFQYRAYKNRKVSQKIRQNLFVT